MRYTEHQQNYLPIYGGLENQLKDDLKFAVAGTPLIDQPIPDAVFRGMDEVIPDKDLDSGE